MIAVHSTHQKSTSRSAVTVLEVLFATVVVVVGLIGIASVIPIAARNAQEATAHTNALNLGLAWTDSFIARGLHRPYKATASPDFYWVWKRDLGSDPRWAICKATEFSSTPTDGRLGSIGHPILWDRLSFCIDPNLPFTSVSVGALRPTVFPYFDDYYNPATNTIDSNQPLQPRMLRVSLANYQSGAVPISPELVKGIFRSVDDIANDDYVDAAADPNLDGPTRDSLPVRRIFARTGGLQNLALRAATNGQYTWMATVSPVSSSSSIFESALVSFVVLSRHEHQLPNLSAAPPSARGERQVSVTPMSGPFTGGTGGRVVLSAHTDISDQVQVGDWVMLGSMIPSPIDVPRYPVFRWFRVIGSSAEPTIVGNIWSREVVLEGPDFPVSNNTIGVLMGGVVTVVERQVHLR